jgi:hypothetical protein
MKNKNHQKVLSRILEALRKAFSLGYIFSPKVQVRPDNPFDTIGHANGVNPRKMR